MVNSDADGETQITWSYFVAFVNDNGWNNVDGSGKER